ncbi:MULTISPECIES: hypothetical protein [Cytobacillus]|uniref:Uncharacterized protein n=1 Tax=Cytobacillus oceanisediminis TaxID=665099 RepID=A0ABX3CL22_9BACI|nr:MULTISPECIES: hypothetical protein [Cytobacillus]EFV74464.1 hypothetical protein HMPREF1013_05344 [Bacillus sp. 2_A_57_CT2]MBG9587380.1 hypothetical protein [Cytobacillus firmus]MDA6082646.1 hypothetical protein [Escherichia coli]OHX41696.1 hypothetical protein BBV17_28055 [Cytobacillus oceanisediminis]
MYFNRKKGAIFSPEDSKLLPFYNLLEKYQKSLDGSAIYEEMVEIYEGLETDLKEETANAQKVKLA